MKLYINYFKLRIITFLQYKTSAIAGMATQFFWGIMMIFIYMAFYSNGSEVWMSLSEIITYTWLHQACYGLLSIRQNDKEIAKSIRDGSVAYEIIRPYNLYFWWYIKTVSKRMAGGLLRILPIIIFASILPSPYSLTLPSSISNFILFLISLVLGVLVVAGLNMIVYTMGFYTYNEQGIGSILNSIMEVLSGGLVPVVLLPKVIQKATYYLPFRLVSDLPFRIYTNNLGISEGLLGIGLQMIWIVILVIVGDLIVKKSLGRVFVQGG